MTETMEASDVTVGQMLRGRTATYSVVRSLGEGCFGKVVEGLNVDTMERVAVKMMKNPAAIREAEDEVRMLERIGELDSDRCNVVSFKERFDHMGLTCLVFEMLDISLWDLIMEHKRMLSPSEIRPMAQQLLVAFDALKDAGVIHSDLKPDNVMLTNRKLEPYRVKLIDFGLARPIAEVRQGQKKQPAGYRAPEVTLGCEFNVPIDMYGLGSTLALLLLEQHLFPSSGYQSMKMMVDLLGMPPDDMLRDGVFSKYYFTKEDDDQQRPTWRLLTPEEFSRVTGVDPGEPSKLQKYMKTFDDFINIFLVDDPEQLEDLRVFVDFLKGLLTVDPRLRLTPKQALQHAFITMTHLTEDSDYSKMCKLMMQRCISTESDVHHRGQPTASPDHAQNKGSSEDSSPSATASPEGISDRAVEPFALDLGLCEDESSTSSEELTSLSFHHSPSKLMFSQPEEDYPVHINQHFNQEIVSSSSEGELPSDAHEDSSSDDGAHSGSSQWITKKEDGVKMLIRISEGQISDTDDISQEHSYRSVPSESTVPHEVYPVHINQHFDEEIEISSSEGDLPQADLRNRTGPDSGYVSYTVETSDSTDDSAVIRVFSQPDDVHVASPCEPLHIQQNTEEKTTRLEVSDITVGQMLRGHNATYSVVRFLGEGSFGMVVEGLNVDTSERVAVKMLKDPAAIREAEDEVRMLERIGVLDSDRCNVVSFKERFDHMGLTCLVFEMLDISLWDLVIDQKRVPLPSEIRPMAQQLLVAFDALKDVGVIHSDLKPDNVMLTNRRLESYGVKLIDFGLALVTSKVEQGMIMQPDAYRAPEVTLGCVYDVPIDMYGLGCTLAFLLLEKNLFPRSEYQSVKMMVDLLGMPPDHMLRDGVYSQYFFTKEDDDQQRPTWRLLTPEEYSRVTGEDPGEPSDLQKYMKTFDDFIDIFIFDDPEQLEDFRVFVDFLKGLLTVDPRLRLTPKQALQHAFITMTHLTEDSDYSTSAKSVMQPFNPTVSDVHSGEQSPGAPDDAQHKGSSRDSLPSTSVSPVGILAEAVEPFTPSNRLHEDDSSTSPEERPSSQWSTKLDQPVQQRREPLHSQQHFDEEIIIGSSEGELPPSEAYVDSSDNDKTVPVPPVSPTTMSLGEVADLDVLGSEAELRDILKSQFVLPLFVKDHDISLSDKDIDVDSGLGSDIAHQNPPLHNIRPIRYPSQPSLEEIAFSPVPHLQEKDASDEAIAKNSPIVKNSPISDSESLPADGQATMSLGEVADLDVLGSEAELRDILKSQFVLSLFVKDLNISLSDKDVDVDSGLGSDIAHQNPPLHNIRPIRYSSQPSLEEIAFSPVPHLQEKDAFDEVIAKNSPMSDSESLPADGQATRSLGVNADLDVSCGAKLFTKPLRDIAKSNFVKPNTATSLFDEACIVSTLEGFRESTAVLEAKKVINDFSYSEEIRLSSANVDACGGFWGVCDEMDKTDAAGPSGLSRQSVSPISIWTLEKSGLNTTISITLTYNSYISWPMDVVTNEMDETEERLDTLEAALLHNSHSGIAFYYEAPQLAIQDTVPMLSLQSQDEERSRTVDVECLVGDRVVHGGELDLVVVFVRFNSSWLQSGVVARVFVVLVWDPGG